MTKPCIPTQAPVEQRRAPCSAEEPRTASHHLQQTQACLGTHRGDEDLGPRTCPSARLTCLAWLEARRCQLRRGPGFPSRKNSSPSSAHPIETPPPLPCPLSGLGTGTSPRTVWSQSGPTRNAEQKPQGGDEAGTERQSPGPGEPLPFPGTPRVNEKQDR